MRKNTRTIQNIKSQTKSRRTFLRRKAYEAFLQHKTAYQTAKELNVTCQSVSNWFRHFAIEGETSIEEKKRGPREFTNSRLSSVQVGKLTKAVVDKTPDQLKFDFALWSSKAIQEYVKSKFDVDICRRTARRYMQRLGLTYQCPVRHAREQNPAAVDEWLNKTYPEIKAEASAVGAKIMWGDESSNSPSTTKPRGYSPCGQAPVLLTPANRSLRCSMISAIGNKGDMLFMFHEGAMNADIFKDFITRLIHDCGTPVFLIVDNLKVHHAKVLAEWLAERWQDDKFKLFYLPSYSPELNPDEYLNRDVKAHLAEKSVPKTKEGMRDAITRHLENRRGDRSAIKRFFEKDEVRYAAE